MARRPHVAFFTPLNPVRSGIADYSEELLPDLARQCDVDAVIAQSVPSNARMLAPARVKTLNEYASHAGRYDVHVYQVGNNVHHHGYMLPVIEQVPGVLVLHDYCLQYLILGSTLGRGDRRALERRMAAQYGSAARRLTWQLLLNTRDPLTLSFAGSLINASGMILVHSAYARDLVLADHPDAVVRVIPMGVRASPHPSPRRATELRTRFGLRAGDLVIASASTPSYNKRLDLVVRAFRRALAAQPNLRLLILGGGLVQRPVRAEIDRGPDSRITHTGWLSSQDYRDLIALSDIVVDLRYPAAAETSASLLRALVAGKPAVIADQGPFSELPQSCCIRVAVGAGEEINVASAISQLASDDRKRVGMGNAAREYGADRCAPSRAAAAYAGCLAEHIERQRRPNAKRHSVSPVTTRSAARALVSGVYNACRVGHLWRTYGSYDTWRRIREEVRRDL